MGEYSALQTSDPHASPEELPPQYNPDIHHDTPPQHTSPSDPLVSAFGNDDSDPDDQWEDDRNQHFNQSPNSSSSASSSSNSQPPTSSTQTSNSTVFSLWNTMLNAINRSHHSNVERGAADGVFGNLVAKEETSEDLEHLHQQNPPLELNEDNDDCTPSDQPPSYDEASADASPSYWETTILSANFVDEIVVGHMAVGSPLSFAWALLLCCAFGIPACLGFYLFHNTYALRSGAFCGLGVNIMEISGDMSTEQIQPPSAPPVGHQPIDPNSFADGPPIEYTLHPTGQSTTDTLTRPTDYTLLSRVVFLVGLFFFLKGIIEYLLALRMRAAIRQQQEEAQEQSEAMANNADSTEGPVVVEVLHDEEEEQRV